MKRIGFTLSETLIVLGIIAVIGTLCVLAINNAKPDENIVMFKQTYLKTQQIVKELITDENIYPHAKDLAMKDKKMDSLLAQNADVINEIDKFDSISNCIITHSTTGYNSNLYSLMCFDGQDGATDCSNTFQRITEMISMVSVEPIVSVSSSTPSTSSTTSTSFALPSIISNRFSNAFSDISPVRLTDWVLSTDWVLPVSIDSTATFNDYQIAILGKGFSDTAIPNPKPDFLSSATASNKFIYSFFNRANAVKQSVSGSTGTMETADGVYWEIYDSFSASDSHAIIEFYTDGLTSKNNSKACSYDSSTCKAPNKFAFRIEKSGQITPIIVNSSHTRTGDDPMACSYLRYPRINKNKQISTNSSVNTCFAE